MDRTRRLPRSRHVMLSRDIPRGREVRPLEVVDVYLSWTRDPTTTMTIHCHVLGVGESIIYFREKGTTEWLSSTNYSSRPFPGTFKTIHWIELSGLSPGTDYEFYIGREIDTIYKFRTMPSDVDSEPIKVIFGGDMYHVYDAMDEMNALAAQQDPHFIVMGGDWAYADSLISNAWKWEDLWYTWTRRMIDSEGRIIPVVPAIGNHEVIGGYGTREDVLFFYEMFAFPQDGYGVLDFGDYLSVIILDTRHSNTTASQNSFLESTLNERSHMKHIIPSFHVPVYSSGRALDTSSSLSVRRNWIPKFEDAGVKLIFEHHDHTYKRTYPILDNEIHPDGIVYLGDGCWGVRVRDVFNPETTWYLEESYGKTYLQAESGAEHPLDGQDANPDRGRHMTIVTFENDKRTIESMAGTGEVFHTFVQEVNENAK